MRTPAKSFTLDRGYYFVNLVHIDLWKRNHIKSIGNPEILYTIYKGVIVLSNVLLSKEHVIV